MSDEPLRVGDRVEPTAGPWVGSRGVVVKLASGRIMVRFDNESRSSTGHGFYGQRWLRKVSSKSERVPQADEEKT